MTIIYNQYHTIIKPQPWCNATNPCTIKKLMAFLLYVGTLQIGIIDYHNDGPCTTTILLQATKPD